MTDGDSPRKRRKKRKDRFGTRRRSTGFLRRLAIYVAAGACIVVGLAGIVLPLLPGWPLVIVGLGLLTGVNPWVRGALHRFLNRHPRLDNGYLKIRAMFTRKKQAAAVSGLLTGQPPGA